VNKTDVNLFMILTLYPLKLKVFGMICLYFSEFMKRTVGFGCSEELLNC
jgi:hypothetical protein